MANIAFPSNTRLIPQNVQWGLRTNAKVFTSALSGETQTVDFPGSRWVCSPTWNNLAISDAAELEAWFASLRGMANRAQLYHFARPQARGGLRGAATTVLEYAKGISAGWLNTDGSGGLVYGDMISIGGQLVMTIGSGGWGASSAQVTFEPALRATMPIETAVVTEKATGLFILGSKEIRVTYADARHATSISADFVEVFA